MIIKTILLLSTTILSMMAFCFGLVNSANQKEINYSDKANMDLNNDELIQFKNYNNIKSFAFQHDTLFCETENGLLHYDYGQDIWLIDNIKKGQNLIYAPEINIEIGYWSKTKIQGFPYDSYTYIRRTHGNWCLINFAGEGATPYKQEIVDTIQRIIYRYPYESINDFIVDDSIIWLGTEFGITQVDRNTLSRIDYYILPLYKKITSKIETPNSIFYLDFDYGLFEYNKQTKIVKPITVTFNNKKNYKFSNSCIIGNKIYISAFQTSRSIQYINGKACLMIYDIVSKTTKIIQLDINYIDAFFTKNEYLIGFGSWAQGYYDGGELNYFGGAIVYNTESGELIQLSDKPINELVMTDSGFEALSIRNHDYWIIREYIHINTENNFTVKNYSSDTDTICRCFDPKYNNGDTIEYDFDNGKSKVLVSQEIYDGCLNQYDLYNKQYKQTLDTLFLNLQVRPTMIKKESTKIEKDKY